MSSRFFMLGFILLSVSVSARYPSNPYHFCGLDLSRLLPFTTFESHKFKREHVKVIEEKTGEDFRFYSLNENGLVTRRECVTLKRGRKRVDMQTSYNYNTRGQLIASRTIGSHESYDTLAYDQDGRLIYYYSYYIYKGKRNKKVKSINYNIKLSGQQGDFYILTDSSNYNFSGNTAYASFLITYWQNKNNETIKTYMPDRTDSVVYENLSDTHLKKYLHKEDYSYTEKKANNFRLGQVYTYRDGLLISETLYEMTSHVQIIVDSCFYRYDSERNLLRTEHKNKYQDKHFYTYNGNGLLLEAIKLSGQNLSLTVYNYHFRKED